MKKFNLLAIITGSIVTTCSIIGSENLFVMFYFYPSVEIVTDTERFKDCVQALPFSFYALLICSNFFTSLMAGTFPVIIGDEKLKHSLITGIIVTVFAALNCYFIPFPLWYKMFSILMFIPSTYLGGYMLKRLFIRTLIAFNLTE